MEQLVDDVPKPFELYPPWKLEQRWDYTSHIMRKVADPAVGGDNEYDGRRSATPVTPLAGYAIRTKDRGH